MPTFYFETLGTSATSSEGQTIEAPDRATAVRLLLRRGVTPTDVRELSAGEARRSEQNGRAAGNAGSGASASPASISFGRIMSRSETASFIRELATAISAGLALVPALRTIARQGRNDRQRRMLQQLIDGVERGDSLSDAMESFGRPFTALTISLVHAGEIAGRLGEVLKQAAALLERDVKLRRSLLSAMLYPIIVVFAVIIAVIIVVTVIVPKVLSAVEGQILTLPMPTRIVQGLASAVGEYWWLMLLGIAGLLYLGSRLYRAPGPRLQLDRTLLAMPVVGPVLRDVAVARFTRTFGTLVSAGLPVLTSLRLTKGTLNNLALERAIEEVSDQVAHGRTIAEPLEQSGYFPPLLVQIVSLGERTGQLDELLEQAAAAFEEKTEQSIKVFTTVLPPIMIVGLTAVVGFVILAVLLPLIEMQESIG